MGLNRICRTLIPYLLTEPATALLGIPPAVATFTCTSLSHVVQPSLSTSHIAQSKAASKLGCCAWTPSVTHARRSSTSRPPSAGVDLVGYWAPSRKALNLLPKLEVGRVRIPVPLLCRCNLRRQGIPLVVHHPGVFLQVPVRLLPFLLAALSRFTVGYFATKDTLLTVQVLALFVFRLIVAWNLRRGVGLAFATPATTTATARSCIVGGPVRSKLRLGLWLGLLLLLGFHGCRLALALQDWLMPTHSVCFSILRLPSRWEALNLAGGPPNMLWPRQM